MRIANRSEADRARGILFRRDPTSRGRKAARGIGRARPRAGENQARPTPISSPRARGIACRSLWQSARACVGLSSRRGSRYRAGRLICAAAPLAGALGATRSVIKPRRFNRAAVRRPRWESALLQAEVTACVRRAPAALAARLRSTLVEVPIGYVGLLDWPIQADLLCGSIERNC